MLPKAARIPHAMTLHGDTRIDNYYWLRDDTRSQPEVLDYLQQENSYGHWVMASQQALQDRILKEIIDRIPQREVSAPYEAAHEKRESVSNKIRKLKLSRFN